MSAQPLERVSTVDALVAALRRESSTAPGRGKPAARARALRRYGVARHTLRAALRALAAEGMVRIEPTAARASPC